MLANHANEELRSWIKLSLVVEREGRVYATDAFEEALRFVTALGGRIMTSTASRLSVVQLPGRLGCSSISSKEGGKDPQSGYAACARCCAKAIGWQLIRYR